MAQQDPVIGTGFKFPIKVNPKGGLDWSSGPQRIQDAIWIILSTSPGERVMRPTFGAGVQDFVFAPNSAAYRTLLATAIKNALTKWEPRIDLVNLTVTDAPQQGPGYVLVTVEYRIRSTNALYNMVYPLYVQEGVG
jgi:phage baseplate assembly protein W